MSTATATAESLVARVLKDGGVSSPSQQAASRVARSPINSVVLHMAHWERDGRPKPVDCTTGRRETVNHEGGDRVAAAPAGSGGKENTDALIRYVRLHFGDGNEAQGRKEIDKAWVEALKLLLDVPSTDREFILDTVASKDPATLAHLFSICTFTSSTVQGMDP
jgi:hypothetical protein